MDFNWRCFIDENASAIFALAGAVGGGIFSFIGALLLKNREFSLAVSSKILDRRIDAHEKVIALAVEMRVMVGLGGFTESGEVRRSPQIMRSRETFEDWFTRFTQLSMKGTSWLSTSSKREVNFIQDYLITLHIYLENVPSERFLDLGEVIRQDFVDLSASLEKKAFQFFQKGIRQLEPDNLDEWHKYERSETERRLHATSLLLNHTAFSKEKIDV
jgi:hypothetical protein